MPQYTDRFKALFKLEASGCDVAWISSERSRLQREWGLDPEAWQPQEWNVQRPVFWRWKGEIYAVECKEIPVWELRGPVAERSEDSD